MQHIPSPKINITPMQFFQQPAPAHAAATESDISQAHLGTAPIAALPKKHDTRFTVVVITLIVGINLCIAWLLGSNLSQRTTTQEEVGFSRHSAYPDTSSNAITSSEKLHALPENSVYLTKEDRLEWLRRAMDQANILDTPKLPPQQDQ